MIKKDPPVVRKHIHAWAKALQSGSFVRRKCSDCSLVQHTKVTDENRVPDSVVHLADADWIEGEGNPYSSTYHEWPTFF